ncbi:hypothetical protein HZH68_009845 [Vespula germanica]|uniref:Uncharacterized protein n=1 Tax=Vespula germanica TaxID=30212 RepID=A0A834N4T9_VESGE|nr:hypothetical protein HZH68_009845 [Vespula germanica]
MDLERSSKTIQTRKLMNVRCKRKQSPAYAIRLESGFRYSWRSKELLAYRMGLLEYRTAVQLSKRHQPTLSDGLTFLRILQFGVKSEIEASVASRLNIQQQHKEN